MHNKEFASTNELGITNYVRSKYVQISQTFALYFNNQRVKYVCRAYILYIHKNNSEKK